MKREGKKCDQQGGRRSPSSMALTGLTYLVALLFFFPILWTVLTGFKTEGNAVGASPEGPPPAAPDR